MHHQISCHGCQLQLSQGCCALDLSIKKFGWFANTILCWILCAKIPSIIVMSNNHYKHEEYSLRATALSLLSTLQIQVQNWDLTPTGGCAGVYLPSQEKGIFCFRYCHCEPH